MPASLRPSSHASRELAHLRVPARCALVPAVAQFVAEVAQTEGFSAEEARGLQLGAEEICANVVTHAYEGDESASYEITLALETEAFVVAVEDQGLPFDPAKLGGPGKLGTTLARAFADDLRFLYHGRGGKRVELRKRRKFAQLDALAAPPAAHAPVPKDEKIELRLMTPEDAPDLARCVWRVFGYSYPTDDLYEPERLAERLRTGAWEGCVAMRASGEIVGQISLVFAAPGDRVPESDNAIVAPHARGHRLMERMKTFLAEHAKARGMAGIFSEAVAAHVYSQRANVHMGAVETGAMLGYLPKSLLFKDVELTPAVAAAPRVSALIYYLPLNTGPERPIFAPPRHADMLREISRRAGLVRRFSETAAGSVPAGQPSFAVTEQPDWGIGSIVAETFGGQWAEHLRAHRDHLCARGLAYLELDLPLCDPGAPAACAEAEALGFFFGGLIPEKHPGGDLLRLQFWNGFTIDPASVLTASDFGAQLRDYAFASPKDSPQGRREA